MTMDEAMNEAKAEIKRRFGNDYWFLPYDAEKEMVERIIKGKKNDFN